MIEDCGTIYDLRIMTNPVDGVNKGFAFCVFATPEAAKNCVNKVWRLVRVVVNAERFASIGSQYTSVWNRLAFIVH